MLTPFAFPRATEGFIRKLLGCGLRVDPLPAHALELAVLLISTILEEGESIVDNQIGPPTARTSAGN